MINTPQELREMLKLHDRRAQIMDWHFVSMYYKDNEYKQSLVEDLIELVERQIPMEIQVPEKPTCPRCGLPLMSKHIKVCPNYLCLQVLELPEVKND